MSMTAQNPSESSAARGLRARYMYAVIPASPPFLPFVSHGTDIKAILSGDLAAIVSDTVTGKVRPERRKLALHHDVLSQLIAKYSVLPVGFGMVANSENDVRAFLEHNRPALTQQLIRVHNRIEMGIRTAWDTPDLIAYFLERQPELRALRDRMFHEGRTPSADEKIALGQKFDEMLESVRELTTQRIWDHLSPFCVETAEDPIRDPREIGRFSCLIERTQRPAFEAALLELAELFDDSYQFDLTGPWAPHHFVELELENSGDEDDEDEDEDEDDEDDEEDED